MRWLVPFLVFLAGCNNCNGSQTTADAAAAPKDAAPEAAAAKPRKAPTNGPAMLSALSADVDKRLAENPSSPEEREVLIDKLLDRAEFMGRASDLVKADELIAKWGPNAHFARAKVFAATMRFEEATKELDQAQSSPKAQTNALRYRILVGHGEYDEALAMQPAPIEAQDALTLANAGFLAQKMSKKDAGRKLVTLSMQKAEEADQALAYAWICFQQGMIHALAGDDVSAESWFGSAANTLPAYAHAAVHLAPSQTPQAADKALAELAKTSDDPELPAARAAVFERLKRDADAKAANAEAAKGYDALLQKLPAAFADHAARFFLGAGNNPKRALELARANAKARPTEDAMDLWMAAAAGNKDAAEACTAAHGMKQLHYSSDRGRALANAKCPDAGVH
jgi:hypothetical protein